MLAQNHGSQAAVVTLIADFKTSTRAGTAQQATKSDCYSALLNAVTATVSAMPLRYLQNFGGITDEFLYERAGAGKVRIKPDSVYGLRRFQPLVQQLARSHWVDHLKATGGTLQGTTS